MQFVSVKPPRCCVPGCIFDKNDVTTSYHSLPDNEDVCNLWLKRIGRYDLKNIEPNVLYSKYKVCGKHFSDHNRVPGSKSLKSNSVPTLNLPDFRGTPTLENSFFISQPKDKTQNVVSSVNDNYSQIKVKEEILSDVEDTGAEDKVVQKNDGHCCSSNDHDYVLKRPKLEPIEEDEIGSNDYPIVVSPVGQNIQCNVIPGSSTNIPPESSIVQDPTESFSKIQDPTKNMNSIREPVKTDNSSIVPAMVSPKKNANKNSPSSAPKTFLFKKTKNLALMIKSALKQCNFPRGTKLVRSIDFVDKGKAMYRIVLPTEGQKKSNIRGSRSLKKKADDNTFSSRRQIGTKSKIKTANPPENKENQGSEHDGLNSEPSSSISITSPGTQSTVQSGRIFQNSKGVAASSNSQGGLQAAVQLSDNTTYRGSISNAGAFTGICRLKADDLKLDGMIPDMPIPDEILRTMEIKVPGLNTLRKSFLWKRLANAIAVNVKAHYKRMYEYKKKYKQKYRSETRERNQLKLRERIKKDALLYLKETNYVMDDDAVAKKIDALFYKTNINMYSSKLLFIVYKNDGLKKGGRRYTVEDKLFLFSFYKAVGKSNYIKLEKLLPLPTIKSLYLQLNKIPFSPGLNRQVFENMRKSVTKLSDEEKYCSLIFDEITLNGDNKQDSDETVFFKKVIKTLPTGDHALVLILRGITRNWKHPIAFIVYSGPIEVANLVKIIKEAIRLTIEIGLKPVATIFNAKNTYIDAVKYLKLETEADCLNKNIENSYFGFLVENMEIIPLFNSSHLFKETRDTLVNYDIEYQLENEKKIASWEHLLQLYSINQEDESVKICPRLTEDNIIPKKMIHSKEDNFSSVFSQRVSSVMKKLAVLSANGIEDKASETADFLYLMDKILDSCSGYASHPPLGKPLKTAVTKFSSHIKFWADAIQIISSFKYLKNDMNFTSSSIGDHWLSALMGYIYLVDKLFKNGVNSIPMRNLNSEPLDKFFYSLRSEGQKLKKPTYYFFLISYRNFVLSNNNLCNHCFLNEENEFEKPFDIGRDYIYDELPPNDDIVCCVHPGCSNKG